MTRRDRHFAGAVAGGVIAGLALSAMLIAGERKSGQPSELAELERTSARRLGLNVPADAALPDAREQAIIQAGHLALSAIAGAAYAASVDADASPVAGGLGFGLASTASRTGWRGRCWG